MPTDEFAQAGPEVVHAAKEAARHDVLDFKSRLGHLHNYGNREEFHVSRLEGPVAENLLQGARDRKIELIVAGTRGRGGLAKSPSAP